MSENSNDMNEVFEEELDDADVITVPIDDTLSNSGEAADAAAVGAALAMKADKSEIQTQVTVNGQSADNQGAILVTAADTKMSSTDNTTVKAAIEAVDAKTAADIPVSSDQDAQTIAQALSSGATRTADAIAMSAGDSSTVKANIDELKEDVSDLKETVAGLDEKTAANIPYTSGGEETIKQHVDAIDQGLVKTVYGTGPDANGDVSPERVPYAENLYTDDAEEVDEAFLIRTTGGSLAISGQNAWPLRLMGNREHTGFTAESITLTVTPMPRSTPAAITASLNKSTFIAYVEEAGTYVLTYSDGWSETPSDYGVTVSNDPVDGDKITIVWDGEEDPVMTVDAVTRQAPPEITATYDRGTFVSYVESSGTITLTYSTDWSADPTDYGITVNNTPIAGDVITVVYVKEVRGTITVATPSGIIGTGWNLYDHTNGYARVKKYSNQYGYIIGGTYTSIAWAATPEGETTAVTPDVGGLFSVPGDGYIIVTGGNGTNTYITPTWSDWTNGPDVSWEVYKESSLSLSAVMSEYFPYGLLRVGTVRDEINFQTQEAINRIQRMAYSDENRAAAVASGRAFEYDENYIYLVMAEESTGSISVTAIYDCDDHGLEWFTGTTVAPYAEILYGQNLKDKLRRDVVTTRVQSFTDAQKKIARDNIGAVSAEEAPDLSGEIGIVVNGNKSALGASAGQYVVLRNSTITGCNDGLYTAAQAIPANTVIDSTYLTAVSNGVGNSLDSKISSLSDQMSKKLFFAASLQEIDLAIPNSGDVAVVAGSTPISSNVGFTSGIVVGVCTRVKNSTTNRIDFLFSQQNGGLSNGRIDVGDNFTYTVTYHAGTLGS